MPQERIGFYPVAARDHLEPLRMLKGRVDQMLFCDIRFGAGGRRLNDLRVAVREEDLPVPSFILGNAITAMEYLKPVDLFFLRGDSGGEGGSALFLLGPRRLGLTLGVIKPGGLLVADKMTGGRWHEDLVSGALAEHRVDSRTLRLHDAQPWEALGLFAFDVV